MTDSKRNGPSVPIEWLEAMGAALQENSSRFEPFVPKRPHAASETLQKMSELEALASASLKPEPAAAPAESAVAASAPAVEKPPRGMHARTSEPEATVVVETRRPRYAPALQNQELVRALLKKAPSVAGSRAALAAQKAAQQRATPTPPPALGASTPVATPQPPKAARVIGEPLPKDPRATPPRAEDFRPAEVPIVQRARSKPGTSR